MAFSLDYTFRIYGTNTEEGMKKHAETRKRVIKRAGIADATHHMNGISSDTASRSPIIAPWAIYPFSDEVCAALTCDFMSFETIISADALAEQLRGPGLDVAIELPNEHGTPVGSEQNVFRVKWRNRTLTVHGGGMNTLFYELLLPHVWAQGVYELLTGNDDPPQSPVTVFGKEYTTWWQ
jgi:hypothetical protein